MTVKVVVKQILKQSGKHPCIDASTVWPQSLPGYLPYIVVTTEAITVDLGNFRKKKLSYDKFSCKKFFVGTTSYRISVNSAC